VDHEWKIGKPSSACALCQTKFIIEGATENIGAGNSSATTPPAYFSALLQTQEGLVRQDFCADCFRDKRPPDVYYFWKTAFSQGEATSRRPAPVDVEFVMEFFKRLEGEAAPQRVAFRYILALMLSRKKLLIADGKTKDAQGAEVQLFREKRGGQQHRVYAPELNTDEITAVTEELGVLLGLTKPPAPAAQPGSGAAAVAEGTAAASAEQASDSTAAAAESATAPSSEAEATRSAS
jgi:hypothetical protein